jgi:GNAT superfamily N-acetyltransferase
MYRLAVAEALRRRGIGRRLVETGQTRLFAMGARRISALLGSDDPEAAAFWIAWATSTTRRSPATRATSELSAQLLVSEPAPSRLRPQAGLLGRLHRAAAVAAPC